MKHFEDMINAAKFTELIKKENPQEKAIRRVLWTLAIIGAIAAIAGIAYAVYTYLTPDYLDDFDDFDDDFDDDFFDEDEDICIKNASSKNE